MMIYHQVDLLYELKEIILLGIPLSLTLFSFSGLSITEMAIVGHLGTPYLAAVSFSQILMDFTLILFTQGFNHGLRALSSQAYGARHYKVVGSYFQVSLLAMTLACLPLAWIWWNIGIFLSIVHVSDEVASLATKYSRWSILWMWPRLIFSTSNTYFVAQQIAYPAAIISCMIVVFNIWINIIFVFGIGNWHGLGFIGSPIAITISLYLQLTLFIAYMCLWKKYHRKTWPWSTNFLSLQLLKKLTSVGIPLMAGNAFENSQLQVTAIFAGITGQIPLSAHNAMLSVFFFLSSPIYGIDSAAMTRIGYYLGAGKPFTAKIVSYLLLSCILTIACIVVVLFIVCRHAIGKLFSSDPLLWKSMENICTLAGAGYFFLGFFYYAMTTLGAQARPLPIMYAFLIGAWGVGVPCAYLFGLYWHYELLGIWFGMCLGYLVTTIIAVTAACRSNWDKESENAIDVAKKQAKAIQEDKQSSNIDETMPLL